MKIIVDTNIVFSAILNSNNQIAQIFIYGNPKLHLYSCEFLKFEMLKHRDKLLKLTNLNSTELGELESFITQNITFINENLLPEQILTDTKKLLQNIDLFDVPFVALATHLDAKLWTGDKKLYKPLKELKFKNIIATAEMSTIIEELE